MHNVLTGPSPTLLDTIRDLVKIDFESTNQFIITQLESQIPLIKDILDHVLTCGGKRIRPMVLLLSARALGYKGQQHITLAAVIELIHTATLLHDDVVDNAALRRGHQTAHLMWGSDASVLVGDFLYSRAFQFVVECQHPNILNIFAKATPFIAEGEILQLSNCRNPDTDEAFYFNIINRKTAKLFEVAAQIGAITADATLDEEMALRDYGTYLGLAYQLIDDALDYSQPAEETGKNLGQDLAEGKMTLPLIHAMRRGTASAVTRLRQVIERGAFDDPATLSDILEIIESTQAIPYTSATARRYAEKAKQALSCLPASPYRQALTDLTDFVVTRTY